MAVVIQPYEEHHESAVKAFNQRLRSAMGDPNLVFSERSHPVWLPKMEGSPLYNQYFVALEGETVHGAYALKYERFFIAGHGECTVACYHHALSEGIVNRSYSRVGSLLLRDAVWREPMLYALGMGGYDRPLPQMLKALGWTMHLVPFYFLIVKPYRFFREMAVLRNSFWKRCFMDLMAFSAVGWVAVKGAQKVRRLQLDSIGRLEITEMDVFSDWAEALWLTAKNTYAVASVRDRDTLHRLYPPNYRYLTVLRVSVQGEPIGWAAVGERRRDAKYGGLRVGSIVDCWARPENAIFVVGAAARVLEQQSMDLIVSNQSHHGWASALEACGFFKAESNFVFAASRKFATLLQGSRFSDFHLTRANGDGLPNNF